MWHIHTIKYYPTVKMKKKTIPCKIMNEPKEYSKWRNSDTKYYTVYYSIYTKCLENAKISVCLGLGEGQGIDKGQNRIWGMVESF